MRDDALLRSKEREKKWKEKIRELKKRNELREEFLSLALHKLRSPLTPIKEYVSKILAGKLGEINPEQRRHLEIVQRQTERLIKLIEELAELSSLKAGRVALKKEPIAISDIMKETVEYFAKEAETRGISLSVQLPAGELIVKGDERSLRAVFSQIVKDYLRAASPGEIVEFSVKREEKVIGDDRFVEILLPRTCSPQGGGLVEEGLRVFMVRSILEAHGGKVHFDDQNNRPVLLLPLID